MKIIPNKYYPKIDDLIKLNIELFCIPSGIYRITDLNDDNIILHDGFILPFYFFYKSLKLKNISYEITNRRI